MQRISVWDVPQLEEEFAKVKKPRGIPSELLLGSLDVVESTTTLLHGIKLGPVRKLIKGFSERSALRIAAWLWLQPGERMLHQEHLTDLQRRVGLDHLAHRDFCLRLMDKCRESLEALPKLSLYMDGRMAELEYRLESPNQRELEAAWGFERLQALTILATRRRRADWAHEATRNALIQAATVVADALAGDGRRGMALDANLMIPVASVPTIGEAARHAEWLWQTLGQGAGQVFVVVQDSTSEQTHLGFWIPDLWKNNRALPGAPSAYHFGATQGILIHDLPRLPLDDEALQGRWRTYFQNGKSGSLFVSLPVRAEKRGEVVGVVNVNIRDEGSWSRVLSKAWLAQAREVASPWLTTAWHAWMVAWDLERTNNSGSVISALTPRRLAAFITPDINPAEAKQLLGGRGDPDDH